MNNRQGRTGGGVALYVSCELNFKMREDLSHSDDVLESLFVEISVPNANIIAGAIHRPPTPSTTYTEFMLTFQNILIQMTFDHKICFISGDFNINLLDYKHSSSKSFIDIVTSY